MDSIDKSLNSLMQQIESIDGKQGHYQPPMGGGGGGLGGMMGSSTGGEFTVFCKQYFLYWSLFLFLVILILVIKPANIYHYNPISRQTTFSWSAFFVTVISTYILILSLYWIHKTYCQ